MVRVTQWLAVLGLVLTVSGQVFGDDDVRPATAEEREFHRLSQELLAAALPAEVPEGWEITDQSELTELEYLPTAADSVPLMVEYGLQWTNLTRRQEAEDRALNEISAMVASQPVSEEQIAAYETLAARVAEATAHGDTTTVERLQPQLEEQAAEINAILARVDEGIRTINRQADNRDTRVSIWLVGNRLRQPLQAEAKRLDIAGFPAFQRLGYHDAQGEWHEAVTVIFVGAGWSMAPGEGAYQLTAAPSISRLSLQSVVVIIEADPIRTASIIPTIDWSALQAAITTR